MAKRRLKCFFPGCDNRSSNTKCFEVVYEEELYVSVPLCPKHMKLVEEKEFHLVNIGCHALIELELFGPFE